MMCTDRPDKSHVTEHTSKQGAKAFLSEHMT
jgi:hypothetical protein